MDNLLLKVEWTSWIHDRITFSSYPFLNKNGRRKHTSNCRRVSISMDCFCRRRINWFCKAENSVLIICSQSKMAVSLTLSSCSRCLSFSVETAIPSTDAISSLFDIRGNISFTASKASTHVALSSRVSALKCSLFVPVNIENLLSSDLLSLMEETWWKSIGLTEGQENQNQRKEEKRTLVTPLSTPELNLKRHVPLNQWNESEYTRII